MTIEGPARDELQGFSAGARRALVLAEREARSLGHPRVGTEHLLLGLLTDDGAAAAALREVGATLPAIRRKVSEAVGPSTPGAEVPASSPRAARAIGRAPRFARDQHCDVVGSEHLLLAVLDVEGTAGQVLRGLGVDIEQLRAALSGSDPARRDGKRVEETTDRPTRAAPPVCPSCHLSIEGGLVGTPVPLEGSGQGRQVVIVSCPACGTALGIT